MRWLRGEGTAMSDMRNTTSSGRAGGSQSDKSKSAGAGAGGGLSGTAQRGAAGVGQEASSQLGEIKDKAREVVDRTREQAGELVGAVKDRAYQAIDEQKDAGAERISGVAQAIHSAADELDEQMPFAADYVREAAAGVERVSSSLRNRSIDDILGSVTSFARQQPVAFFGAAVLIGFLGTRFLKSSAERRERRGQTAGRSGSAAVSEYPWESEPPASARGRTYRSAGGETVGRSGGRVSSGL
jgi:ElaB/YqjD/DUF883 family membrane-anchored ribosome-binding protein